MNMPELPELPGVQDRLVKPKEARQILGMPVSTFGDKVRAELIVPAERTMGGHRRFSFLYLLTIRARMLGVSAREALERMQQAAAAPAAG